MDEVKCQGIWLLYEVVNGVVLTLVSYGNVIAWDTLKGFGKITLDSRVWVGSTNSRAGIMTGKVKQIWETQEGVRFEDFKKTYELRRVESSSDD